MQIIVKYIDHKLTMIPQVHPRPTTEIGGFPVLRPCPSCPGIYNVMYKATHVSYTNTIFHHFKYWIAWILATALHKELSLIFLL